MEEYLMPFAHIVLEMAPFLLLGFFFAGALHAWVPRRYLGRYLSGSDLRSVLTAAAVGVPLPLCSCGVIPTAMSLRKNGASKGATVAFLISTPQTGIDSILATGSLMGWPMALIRPFAAFVTAIFGGHLVNRCDSEADGASAVAMSSDELPHGIWAKVKDMLHYGYVELMQDIGKWLVVGLLIAGIITVAVPDNFFDFLRDYPLLNMFLVLLVAMPMYVCATGSIPVAVALMMKGLTPGAALVFLMAGPATNFAASVVVGKVLKKKALAMYLVSIVAGSIAFGLAIDYLCPASWFAVKTGAECCTHHGYAMWKVVSAVVLGALLVNALMRLHSHSHEHDAAANAKRYKVVGMGCNHCRINVENALKNLEGVDSVEVSLESGIAVVTGSANSASVCECVEELGFTCEGVD